MADSASFDVQLGDIILTATDGLFDNMPDYMILQELKKLKVQTVLALNVRVLVRQSTDLVFAYTNIIEISVADISPMCGYNTML